MAVMQNSIIFGGIDSADFGIYIGGEGTFDAPKRDVEMISIPGRNGAFALDKGRFENIEVTYSAFNYETDLATFAQQLSDFRNAICSQKGYQRLTDTFHPDEYRMAAYIDGLEIKPIEYNTAATFDIKFNCKPQRYLTSGEEAIDVDSGDVVTNPTLFEAAPMLEVEGYGDIVINGETITLQNTTYGDVDVGGLTTTSVTDSASVTTVVCEIDTSVLINGDDIYVRNVSATVNYKRRAGYTLGTCTVGTKVLASATTNADGTVRTVKASIPRFDFGTEGSSTSYVTFNESWTYNGASYTNTQTIRIVTTYDGASTLTFKLTAMVSACYGSIIAREIKIPQITATSTMVALGHPTYIDLDIGEAYNVISGKTISLNNVVSMPAELPKLKVGDSEITFDNTVTDLKVVPRYWKI